MSKDIRSYFLSKGMKSDQSSSEENVTKKNKKRVIVIDSDSDEAIFSPKKKKSSDSDKKISDKKKTTTESVKSSDKKQPVKLKPVNLSDVFGKETFKRSSPKKVIPKDKVSSNDKEPEVIHSDDEFEATLSQIDKIEDAVLNNKVVPDVLTTIVPESIPPVIDNTKIEKTPNKSSHKKKQKGYSDNFKIEVNKVLPQKSPSTPKIETPSKTEANLDTSMNSPSDPLEKKRQHALSYMKYLQRGGPKCPGSKEVPEGKAGCFSGLVFVITGVLDSLERDEVTHIIEKYGGKVTSGVSRKTSYVIYGEEAGQSKLTKAEALGTPQINEDEFLKLIVSRSEKSTSQNKDDNHSKKAKKRAKNETSKEDESNFSPKCIKLESNKNDTHTTINSEKNKNTDCHSHNALKSNNLTTNLLSPSSSKSIKENITINNSIPYSSSTNPIEFANLKSSLWVDKYKPTKTKQVIGQQGDRSALQKLTFWLESWRKNHSGNKKHVKPSPWAKNDDGAFFKAALLSGPPGIGKTTMAHLVSKELGYDIVEFNASDTRSKKLLHQEITELLSTKTLVGYFNPGSEDHQQSIKHVLIMDEVDGMAGNEDRGGVQELIQLIKTTLIPIICMCNDRNHPKIRSLSNYCFDLRVMKPRLEQIRGAMMSVCFKEGLKIPADTLGDIICGTNFDIRQILHYLSLWAAKDKHRANEELSKGSIKPRKDMKVGPWDVVKKVFSVDDHKNMSIHDKSDLFFHDYSINPLFVQENYLSVAPAAAKGSVTKILDCIARTAESISMGDVVEKCIRRQGAWSLLPVQAMFSSVIPGDIMEGYMRGPINFPAWLGKNSRSGKLDRLLQELNVHTRLSTSGSKQALNLEYLPHIRDAIIHPLVTDGSSGVPASLEVLQNYNLLREDLESILELTMWPNQKDPMSSVESKVKAALTRAYNKGGILTPYSVVHVVKKRSAGGSAEDFDEDEDGEDEEEVTDDLSGDAMIKAKKPGKRDEGPGKTSHGKSKNSAMIKAKKPGERDEGSGKTSHEKSKNSSESSSKSSQKKGRGRGK